ncbi:ribonuclease Y [Synoicihabitans lomoniglobus]|uniref:Ribonuclease Y n=1 Tax=Synoicihabitans lomoniglobus TaxID=2909285 RepID=A0AAF0A0T9_9BACT|nr:ribonuclease Y [Opitutaceae bacterium LMO-M01]WED65263.1 ribonuclease Y [Opitutaceae bacterium LMO-M01]
MQSTSAADFALLIAEGDPVNWSLPAALVLGMVIGFAVVRTLSRGTLKQAAEQAKQVVDVARREAAVAAEEVKQAAEKEIATKRSALTREYDRRDIETDVRLREIRSHEESLAALDFELEQKGERLKREAAAIKQARDAIRAQSKDLRKRLEGVAKMDAEEIRIALREEVAIECQDELRAQRRQTLERSEQDLNNEARRILIASMQRLSSQPNNDLTATIVQLPTEEMKGRIIGREGRNIKSFEAATGVTLLIDESPQMVLISSFDPVRREVARAALEGLVKDGRIHPANIEEFVNQARDDIELKVQEAGEDAVGRLSINGLNPEIIKLLGRLKYRFSYAQNALDHSIEVGFLCSMLASELGLDPAVAKRAGLLHDIGKGIESDYEGSHAMIGADFVKRHGETPTVVNAVAAHHEEVPPESLYAGLVILADTVSAVRPGARAESMSSYIQRLDRLEKLAASIDGVRQAYAIQAGREVRVVVNPNVVSDDRASEIAKELRQRIEDELQYPSTIRVTVIRESRYTETAT